MITQYRQDSNKNKFRNYKEETKNFVMKPLKAAHKAHLLHMV